MDYTFTEYKARSPGIPRGHVGLFKMYNGPRERLCIGRGCGETIFPQEEYWSAEKRKLDRIYCQKCAGFMASRYSMIEFIGVWGVEEEKYRVQFDAEIYDKINTI